VQVEGVEGAFLWADVNKKKTVLLTSLKKEVEECCPNGPFDVGYFC